MKATLQLLLLTSLAALSAFTFIGCKEQDEPKPEIMDGGMSPGAVAIENPNGVWRSIKDTTIYLPGDFKEHVLVVKSTGFNNFDIRDIRASEGMSITLIDSVLADLEPCEREITQIGAYVNQRDTTYYYKQRLQIKDAGANARGQQLSFTITGGLHGLQYSNFTFLVK